MPKSVCQIFDIYILSIRALYLLHPIWCAQRAGTAVPGSYTVNLMSQAQDEQHKCSICMDVLGANGGVSTTECGMCGEAQTLETVCSCLTLKSPHAAGHPFCSECLAQWEARSTLCPVCRADQRTLGRRARNREQGIEDDGQFHLLLRQAAAQRCPFLQCHHQLCPAFAGMTPVGECLWEVHICSGR